MRKLIFPVFSGFLDFPGYEACLIKYRYFSVYYILFMEDKFLNHYLSIFFKAPKMKWNMAVFSEEMHSIY